MPRATKKRRPPKDPRVSVSGARVKAALEAAGLSVNAAAGALKDGGHARVSQTGLNNIVLGLTTTTRRSVLNGLAAITGQHEDWLGGFGGDLSPIELIAIRVGGGFWDEDYWDEDNEIRHRSNPADDDAEKVRKIDATIQRLLSNWRHRQEIVISLLQLDRWVQLLGDSRSTELSDEARLAFAVSLGRALRIATTQPIPNGRTAGQEQPRPRAAGLRALAKALERAKEQVLA